MRSCRSGKVKRFFLWSAEKAQHPWVERLDPSAIDLGAGKRQFYSGGVYDPGYRITVPPDGELPNV